MSWSVTNFQHMEKVCDLWCSEPFCNSKSPDRKKIHHVERDSNSDDSILQDRHHIYDKSKGHTSKCLVHMKFHSCYTVTETVQLDTGADCSAMSTVQMLSILQAGKVKLKPRAGSIRPYDQSVIMPLRQYALTVSLAGAKTKITFYIIDKASFVIIYESTCMKHR